MKTKLGYICWAHCQNFFSFFNINLLSIFCFSHLSNFLVKKYQLVIWLNIYYYFKLYLMNTKFTFTIDAIFCNCEKVVKIIFWWIKCNLYFNVFMYIIDYKLLWYNIQVSKHINDSHKQIFLHCFIYFSIIAYAN